MKILSIGGGAREHAIVKALAGSDAEVYAVMGNKNPGIARLCKEFILVKETQIEKVVEYARSKSIELAVVGPEAPLGEGIVNELERQGIKVASPTKEAAEIEISKEFMRNLMRRYKIPGLVEYGVFSDLKKARKFIESLNGEVVIKPVGLTGGKGVKIVGEQLRDGDDALMYAKKVIENKIGGSAKVVIERRVEGEEFTLQAFCDGRVAIPMPAVQDHKRAFEGDKGPNTGGMGSYSQEDFLLPFLERDEYEESAHIVQKIVDVLRRVGRPYKGIFYGQFMLTAEGAKIIECNARFGDPEAMNVLPLLESDFVDICWSTVDGTLSSKRIKFSKKATVCKYAVPRGYGIKPLANAEVIVDEKEIEKEGAELFYASVNERDGKLYTTTSRALATVGFGDTVEEAEEVAERGIRHVGGEIFVRHDIGKREAIERKVRHMNRLRGIT